MKTFLLVLLILLLLVLFGEFLLDLILGLFTIVVGTVAALLINVYSVLTGGRSKKGEEE